MPLEFVILWAGRHQRRVWEELCADFRRRIGRHAKIRESPIKARVSGNERRLRAEGEALLAAVPQRSWTIALDRRGEMLSSAELAQQLARLGEEWPHPIAFLVGSDLGLDSSVLAGVRQVLSLGPLTLPHELARLILYEQLYRAVAIQAGINYHRQPL